MFNSVMLNVARYKLNYSTVIFVINKNKIHFIYQ